MPISSRSITFLIALFLYPLLQAQVTADFTYDVTEGCGSLQVSFNDASSSTAGAITNWQWDLGGAMVSMQNPSRTFGSPGQYTICLTVTDDQNNSATECKTDLIHVFELPVADFAASPRNGCVPTVVTFEDLSSSADGTIIEWLWGLGGSCGTVMGDGSSPPAICTYSIPDGYDISLTVKDDNGCSGSVTKSDYIIVSPEPEVMVAANATFDCTTPFGVSFSNNSPTANIDFTWNFGNGDVYTGAFPPTVFYDDFGSYTVEVIAENSITGCIDTLTLVDYINVGHPIDIAVSQESGCEGESFSFSDNSPETADNVEWDFGDGNTSTTTNPNHTYQTPGCYTVTLVRWLDGCRSEVEYPVCIEVFSLPEATYNNNNSIGCSLPHVVNFAGLPITTDIVSWSWDFGDGNTSTSQNPTHIYEEFGDFFVELTVTNAEGCEFRFSNNPIAVIPLEADMSGQPVSGCRPLTFNVQDNSSSITNITNWEWTVETNVATYTELGSQVSFTIPDTGVFDIVLIVTNDLGCRDTATFEDWVTVGEIPTIDFMASALEECIEVPIQFTDLSSSFVEAWHWEFGDGDESFIQNPTHEFQDTGLYNITLTGIHNGCANTLTIDDYIRIKEPLAKFRVVQSCDNLFFVQLEDRSVGAETVFWDFGVAGTTTDTSSLRNPTFTFPGPGNYNVTQTAFNATTNCSHSTTEVVSITFPEANFNVSSQQGCVPMNVQMEDISAFAAAWEWSAPGGFVSNFLAPEPIILYNTPGAYSDIQLIITDVNGCRDTMVFTDTIFVNDINVDFDVDINQGCFPLTVNLMDQSTNLFTNNTQWDWTIGTVGSTSGQNATFTIDDVGYFPLTLTVRDAWGCSFSRTIDSLFEVTRPIAEFRTLDTLSCTQHCVQFEDSSQGKGLTYSWDFGDGNSSTEASPLHCYATEGVFTVCQTVTDIYGCDSTLCLTDYVVIADPVAALTTDSVFASCPPLPVNFTNLSMNADTFTWDFGDGSGLSNLENPSHVYTLPGSYLVTLIAESTPFCRDTAFFDDLIVLDGPEGTFSFEIDSSCAPQKVTFFGESIANYFFVWDYGDGVLDTSATQVSADTIVHYYTQEGTYFPSMSLIDGDGCQRTIVVPQSIFTSRLDLDFQASDTLFCDGNDQVQFTNLSFSSAQPVTYLWLFEDGSPALSTGLEPAVDFDGIGGFNVMLIGDNGECRDTLSREEYIRIGPSPSADFNFTSVGNCQPLEVDFTDISMVDTGFVADWAWDFGDGATSEAVNPSHIFDLAGDVDVQLTVSSDLGCIDSMTQTISIEGQTPIFAGEDRTICIGELTQLQALINGDTTGGSFIWTPVNGLSCSDCLNPIASPADTTIYTFIYTNANGCESQSQVRVNVKPFPVPVIDLIADTSVCASDVVQLFVDGGTDVFSYQWDDDRPGLDCYDNCFNPIAGPLASTTYVVTVTNVFGCSSQDSVAVEVIDQFQEFLGADRTICDGDTVQLNADFGSNPTWLNPNELSCSVCPDPVAYPEATNTFYVSVTTDIGCEVIDSVVINVVEEEDVDAGEDLTICIGSSTVLPAFGEGTVVWSPSIGLSDPNIINPTAAPDNSTQYFMTLTNGDCIIRDSIFVAVGEKTEISLTDITICEGDEVVLEVN
ncbi:MAG: PKD domain-containing protein, partial [Bacteroidota bacterium]